MTRQPSQPFGMQHIALPPAQQLRCAVWNRGSGTVVARLELAGLVTGYDVELDRSAGRAVRVLPAEMRLLAHIVQLSA